MAFGSFVQTAKLGNAGATPSNLAFPGNVTAGDILIATQGVVFSSGTPVFGTPTDTQGNTWVAAGPALTIGGSTSQFFVCLSALSTGPCTVTFTNSGAVVTGQTVTVSQYGGAPTAALDGFQQVAANAQINTVNGPTTTKTDLVLLLGNQPSNGTTVSVASGGFTLRSPGTNQTYAVADLTSVPPGPQSGGINWNVALRSSVAILAISATFSISGNAGTAGATISWSGASSGSTTADGSGNYTIPTLQNGSYTITPSKAGFSFSPISSNQTVSGANISSVNFVATPVSTVYSVPDCRVAPFGPNNSRTVQGTKIYDVQTSNNAAVPGTDSRVPPNIPVDSRVSSIVPQNSRTPGTFGPGS